MIFSCSSSSLNLKLLSSSNLVPLSPLCLMLCVDYREEACYEGRTQEGSRERNSRTG